MFINYYKTATRSILRDRFHSVINVIGLSMGISFALLVGAYVWSEWQVNRQLTRLDRQFILNSHWKKTGLGPDITTLGPLAKALKENYPALVANYYRWDGVGSNISVGEKHFREGLQLGDSSMLSMFGFPLLHGDAHTAFNDPFSVVITADVANKYFGRTDVVGQNLSIENFSGGKKDFRITGVLQTPSRNSVTWLNENNNQHFFIPSTCMTWFGRNMDWKTVIIVSYIELQPGVSPDALKGPLAHLIKTYAPAGLSENLEVNPLPLSSYYLNGGGGVVKKMLYTLSLAALFILAMAIINFVNLSVSRSGARMKEIGIRKVLGSLRKQLIWQFLSESVLLSAVATLIGLFFYLLLAPYFSGMLGKKIPALSELPACTWIIVPAFALLIGYISGLYPAFMLSALSSVDSLKGGKASVKENIFLRKGLVGFQFATATFVFVCAIIISQQISLFFSDRLGYNKEYIISAQLPRDWSAKGVQRMETVRAEFARMPGVKEATLSYEIPNGNNGGSVPVCRAAMDSTRAILSQLLGTDEHYAATYQIPLVAGVFFNRENENASQDSTRLVINESEAKALGWQNPSEAVGQSVKLPGASNLLFTISGVVRDFHFDGMSKPIVPYTFMHVSFSKSYRFLSFKIRPGNVATAMNDLQQKWASLLPGAAFEYQFMDESLRHLYQSEMQLKKAANAATFLALVIALLGVLGLISYSVQKRKKEIAIRKVIGASVPAVIRLFIREYLPLLILAGFVASPVAYFVMHRWLNDYATRIGISVWPFAGAIGCLAGVMVTLIVLQTLKAVLSNPIKSLKAE